MKNVYEFPPLSLLAFTYTQFFFCSVVSFKKKNNPLPWCAASRCRLCASAQRFERPNKKTVEKRAGVTVTLILNVHHVERRGVNCKQEVPRKKTDGKTIITRRAAAPTLLLHPSNETESSYEFGGESILFILIRPSAAEGWAFTLSVRSAGLSFLFFSKGDSFAGRRA